MHADKMAYMVKTQVYLTQEDYEDLRHEAFTTKRTMSEIVRFLIRGTLTSTAKHARPTANAGQFMLGLAEKYGFKGPKHLASNLDSYLYGNTK